MSHESLIVRLSADVRSALLPATRAKAIRRRIPVMSATRLLSSGRSHEDISFANLLALYSAGGGFAIAKPARLELAAGPRLRDIRLW